MEYTNEFFEAISKRIRDVHFFNDLPVIVVKDGWIVKKYKDGQIEKIKKVLGNYNKSL